MFSEIKEAYSNPIKKQLDNYQNDQFKKITGETGKNVDDATFGSSIFDDTISYQSILKKPTVAENRSNILYPIIFGVFMIIVMDIFLNIGRTQF